MTTFLLSGLDGSNLLGFLAAVGSLRTATRTWPDRDVRMSWERSSGGVRPRLHLGEPELSEDDLVEAMAIRLRRGFDLPALSFAEDLNVTGDDYRLQVLAAAQAATLGEHEWADFLASFGSEVALDRDGRILDTALRTMSGACHQHFIGTMRQLAGDTTAAHLRAALLSPWRYEDPKPSLRWDPLDDRSYALRWKECSGDPILTVRGANRLAVEALPLLPTMPVGASLQTTALRRFGPNVAITWPIWTEPLVESVVRVLLSLSELQEEAPDRVQLRARGIVEVFRSQRVTQGKFRNFAQAISV